MKKLMTAGLLLLLAFGCTDRASTTVSLPESVAHRGCWLKDGDDFYINENCPAGVRMARRFGYPAVECDVKYTADSVMVLMHDKTINRTMRLAEGYGEIPEPVRVGDVTFDELRSRYVLASTDPALRLPIPTLDEELAACKEEGIIPMLHSILPESYRRAQEVLGEKWIAFTARGDDVFKELRTYSNALVLLDPGETPADSTVARLRRIGGWAGMSTMRYKMLDADYIRTVKDAGFEVQASIFPAPNEQRAVRDAVTIQLSDFWWFQTEGREPGQTWKKGRTRLQEGETLTWTPDGYEFGAMTLELAFTGKLSVTLNGVPYSFDHGNEATEVLGRRMYKTAPELVLKADGPVTIRSAKASLYEI